MTDSNDDDGNPFFDTLRVARSKGAGRGKTKLMQNTLYGAVSSSTRSFYTFGKPFTYSQREKRFAGQLLSQDWVSVEDASDHDSPIDLLTTMIHRVRQNGGYERDDYVFVMSPGTKYAIRHQQVSQRGDFRTDQFVQDVADDEPTEFQGIPLVTDKAVLPDGMAVLVNMDRITYDRDIMQHPIAVGLNIDQPSELQLRLDGTGTVEVTETFPHSRDKADEWLPDDADGEDRWPTAPAGSELDRSDEAPSPTVHNGQIGFDGADDSIQSGMRSTFSVAPSSPEDDDDDNWFRGTIEDVSLSVSDAEPVEVSMTGRVVTEDVDEDTDIDAEKIVKELDFEVTDNE